MFSPHGEGESKGTRDSGVRGGDKTWGGKPQLRHTSEKRARNPCKKPVKKKKISGLLQKMSSKWFSVDCQDMFCVCDPEVYSTLKCILHFVCSAFVICLCYAFVGTEKKTQLLTRISVVPNTDSKFGSRALEAEGLRLTLGTRGRIWTPRDRGTQGWPKFS